MKYFILSLLVVILSANTSKAIDKTQSVKVITDGFNNESGIVIANEVRGLIDSDSLLCQKSRGDSIYLVVEIYSWKDGNSSMIKAEFARVSPLGRDDIKYQYVRRLIPETLEEMRVLASNIVDKVRLIQQY